jgi:hypothetical protein
MYQHELVVRLGHDAGKTRMDQNFMKDENADVRDLLDD